MAVTTPRDPGLLVDHVDEAPTGGVLRLATAGSVDDGKSTLIGRLLLDANAVLSDQLEAVEATSRRRGDGYTDLSLLTDGLRAEREQGITIDVAYRYFSTPRRSFVIADTPGHVQYTRNMVTGCSTADVAVILVDARRGLVEQSRRHACIAALLGVRRLVLCVNKMDLVGHDERVFRQIGAEFSDWALGLGVAHATVIPTSALHGGNVVTPWTDTPWYDGPTLLEHLERIPLTAEERRGARFPVQLVIRPQDARVLDYRGYAGRVAGGTLRPGDEVVVLPSGVRTRVARLDTFDGPLEEAGPGRSVTVLLEDDVDVSRGDLIAGLEDRPAETSSFEATVCWLAERPLEPGGRYVLKHTTRTVRALVDDVRLRLDVNTLAPDRDADTLRLNEIGRLRLQVAEPLHVDPYRLNRTTGSFILIDEATNDTVGAGLVEET